MLPVWAARPTRQPRTEREDRDPAPGERGVQGQADHERAAGSPPDLFQSWGGGVLKQQVDAGLVKDITAAGQPWTTACSRRRRAVHRRRQDLRDPVRPRHGRALVQQGPVRPGRDHRPPATGPTARRGRLKPRHPPIALGGKDKWPGHFYWATCMRIGGLGRVPAGGQGRRTSTPPTSSPPASRSRNGRPAALPEGLPGRDVAAPTGRPRRWATAVPRWS